MGSSSAYWYVENKIVYVHNVGNLSAEDFRQVDREIIALMASARATHPTEKVHVFVDSTAMDGLPSIMELEGGRILKYMQEPNCGWSVVVGHNNPFLKVLSRLLTSVMGVNLYMSDSLRKGQTIFGQLDPALATLPDIEDWKAKQFQEDDA